MNTPLVSIIIPTYNRAHLIGETLDSVLSQTYTNWECIVVDDGSTDETAQLLNEYCEKDARFQYRRRPSDMPKGANACRNYGFGLGKGEYVNWFDDDDVMLEDFLKIKVDAFTPNIDLVICSGYFVDEKLVINKEIKLINTNNLFKDYALWNLHLLTPSILFRKSFLDDKELFSFKISRGQETEFFSRLFFQLEKELYQIINLPLFLYRQHQETKSTKDLVYISKNQKGVSFIYKSNLQRGMSLNDKEIISVFYNRLLSLWFRALSNRDFILMDIINY